jgi:hypothetical protein
MRKNSKSQVLRETYLRGELRNSSVDTLSKIALIFGHNPDARTGRDSGCSFGFARGFAASSKQ